MRVAWAAILVALAASARADTIACKPAGAVVFEIAQRADRGHKLVTATSRLFANGAVETAVVDRDGKLMRSSHHCLEPAVVHAIVDDLKSARWQTARARGPCVSHSPRLTTYAWNGRVVFTERACGEALDEPSQRTLARMQAWLRVPALDEAILDCRENPLAAGCS